MLNFLFILVFFNFFPKENFKSEVKKISKLNITGFETSIINDAEGFYPSKIFLKLNTNLKIKIANLLNKDASFMNGKLNVFKNIKPKSSIIFDLSFKEPGVYEFKCPLNGNKMEVVVE